MSLFGDANKWGKMPYTVYPKDWTQANPMLEHDILTSRRTYRYAPPDVVTPFGHGLSLTEFKLTGLKTEHDQGGHQGLSALTGSDSKMRLSLGVANAGGITGDEVVMAYVMPLNISLSTHPVKSLFDFARVKDITPGDTTQVTFEFTAKAFAIPNQAGDIISSPGHYLISVENGAGEKLHTELHLTGDEVTLEKFPDPATK